MPGRVRFVCLLHSHQPVGNFDHVIEEAYKLSYLPYVEAFEQFPQLPLTNHFSGCLLEWLDKHHPEYLDRLAQRAGAKHEGARPWEMIGGGFYEPIMPILPERDRIGQIKKMANFIETRFGVRPRGLWLPERVWEPALVKDLADAGVEYLTLDDSHFRAAGLEDKELNGAYIAEDQGRIVQVYPASEKLRYMIPYATVPDCIAWLKSNVPHEGERVVCYADDGEKFGVWPHSYKHVYQDGWLRNFLSAIQHAQNEGWLVVSTLSEVYDQIEPLGPVCLPENSYREMTEWVLPAQRLAAYENAMHAVKKDDWLSNDWRMKQILPLVRGGNWRAFKNKYAEGARMYAKMMEVSQKVSRLPLKAKLREKAEIHLYRGQCNCPYWHGVFGGMYLPHLRSAIYSELIRADKLADEMDEAAPISRQEHDFDFDGENEYKLANQHLALYVHPRRGGHLYELDLRDAEFNLCDTFSRRFEAYHEKVARAIVGDTNSTASIHDLVLAKQPGLSELLKYDTYMRESLVDHISSRPLTSGDMLSGNPPSDVNFRAGRYETKALNFKRSSARGESQEKGVAVELKRRGYTHGTEIVVTKRVMLRGGNEFEVQYTVENAGGAEIDASFGVEMNYNLLAGDAHDRYYYHEHKENAGRLATSEDFGLLSYVGLKDHWMNISATLRASEKARVVVSPVKTVSQSEGGFEAVYQSSCILLQWPLKLAPSQSFSVRLTQEIGTARD